MVSLSPWTSLWTGLCGKLGSGLSGARRGLKMVGQMRAGLRLISLTEALQAATCDLGADAGGACGVACQASSSLGLAKRLQRLPWTWPMPLPEVQVWLTVTDLVPGLSK